MVYSIHTNDLKRLPYVLYRIAHIDIMMPGEEITLFSRSRIDIPEFDRWVSILGPGIHAKPNYPVTYGKRLIEHLEGTLDTPLAIDAHNQVN